MSDWTRDIQFEVQYLISLTLVVFGLLSIRMVRENMNEWIAYGVIFALSVHYAVFTFAYGFSQSSRISVDSVELMESYSWPVLASIGLLFMFLVFHASVVVLYSHFSNVNGSIFAAGEIVIKYFVPMFLVGIMGYSFKRQGYDPTTTFEGVNIKVVPEFIRVFPQPEDSKALLVKVENNGSETFTYNLQIDIPEILTLHQESGIVTDEFTHEGTLEPGRADRFSFELSHISQEHSAELLTVKIKSGGATYTTDVELELAT